VLPSPGEAARHRLGRDHKAEAPFLSHSWEELGVVRVGWNGGLEPPHVELANGVLRHQLDGLGPQYLPTIDAALVEEQPLKCEIVRRRAVEPATPHLEFRVLGELEGNGAESPALGACVHADKPRTTVRDNSEASVRHPDRREDVLREKVAERLAARPLDRLAGPIDVDAVVHLTPGSNTGGGISAAFWQVMMPGTPFFSI
jgi:hypothetical protein